MLLGDTDDLRLPQIGHAPRKHMIITDKLLARVAIQGEGNRVLAIDSSALVTRLLLFQTYILQSIQLDELPFLTKVFGVRGLIRLFEVGALRIIFESYTLAQVGQARAELKLTDNSRRLPLGFYSFMYIRLRDQEKITQQKLALLGQPLAETVRASLIAMPDTFSAKVFDGFYSDIRRNLPVVESSIRHQLRRFGINPKKLKVQITEVEPEDFRVDSNLQSEYSLSDENAHRVVEKALMEVGGLNQRLAEMSTYAALSGIRDEDRPLLEGKLEAVADLVDSADHQGRFNRVAKIAGLHTISAGHGEIDAEKLIRLRESDECRAFRDWLHNTDAQSDAELRKRLAGINSRIREAMNSRTGKILRFVISNGLSLAATPIGALGISAVDSFILDQLAPKDAIVSFLSESYPSLFRSLKQD
jgi:hypothetical protein